MTTPIKSNTTKSAKTPNRYAHWISEQRLDVQISKIGFVADEEKIKRVRNFCLAEAARLIEAGPQSAPPSPLARAVAELTARAVAALPPAGKAAADAYQAALLADLASRPMSVAQAMPEDQKTVASTLAAQLSAPTTTGIQPTPAEILELIYLPALPPHWQAGAAQLTPVLVAPPAKRSCEPGDQIWQRLLGARGLDSDKHLKQALAWALHFGFQRFAQLPAADQLDLLRRKSVHVRTMPPAPAPETTDDYPMI